MQANDDIDIQRSQVIKDTAFMPGLDLNPFLPLSAQTTNNTHGAIGVGVGVGNEIEIQNENTSMFISKAEYDDGVADVGLESLASGNDAMHDNSVLQQYILDMVNSGKSQAEVTAEIEKYFASLTGNCDNEIQELQQQLEVEKALHREEAASEVVLKAAELDHLSNLFLECVHAQRKSLR
jgi:hypothetical protein